MPTSRATPLFSSLGAAIVALAFATPALLASCSDAGGDADGCMSVTVDPFKELMIVDEEVIGDVRARNDVGGPWSFRYAVENMAPEGTDPSEFVRNWLTNWVNTQELNGFPLELPNENRIAGMNRRVMCPWLKRTPANACNDDCSACAGNHLDLALAPFRLMAIVNRIDKREATSPYSGEGRLLFALTDGAADDPASAPLAMVVNFEYGVPADALKSARAWHALGSYPDFGEDYKAALENVTNAFVQRGRRPEAQNGSAISQIRTNESVLNWNWQLRQFGLGSDGMLVMQPAFNTPATQLNNTAALSDFVRSNADAVLSEQHVVPVSFLSGSVELSVSWQVSGVDPAVARKFSLGTCNGCHSLNPTLDAAFHISPFRSGRDRLSPFMIGETSLPEGNEVTRRTLSMREALCQP